MKLNLIELKSYEEAIECFDQAFTINTKHYDAIYNKACCYALLNDFDQAIKNLRTTINLNNEYRGIAKTDTDFNSISNDARFQALIKE